MPADSKRPTAHQKKKYRAEKHAVIGAHFMSRAPESRRMRVVLCGALVLCNKFGTASGILQQSHETKIHVQLLMAVE